MVERGHAVLPIVLRDLTYKPGGRPVIAGLSARIETPGVTALIGANGAGKSVCLRLIDGLLTPTSGSIAFAGGDVDDVRRAFVFQRTALIRASTEANVALALKPLRLDRRTAHARVAEALAMVDLDDRAREAAHHLSGGEIQRLALARAMVAKPALLLLDEPTASLDPSATEHVERLIRAIADGGTKVLLVSHNLGQVSRLAEDVLVLAKGVVVEHGPTRAILTSPRHPDTIRYLNGELPWPSSAPAS